MKLINEKEFWESFRDQESISKAIWADEDKKVDECLGVIEPFLKINSGKKIFDLGCGNGRLLYPMANKYPNASFTGIDISSSMIEFAKKSANIEYVENDGETIPFGDDYFDGGYSMIMFQHIPNESFAGYLKEVSRVLKKGGIFRFQFVEGVEQHFLSHNASTKEVLGWVSDAGMKVASLSSSMCRVWRWVTAVK